ncbi:MAG TPA: SCO family protein [Bacteroidales bacterium]|nr:SCO family protein [Bacteroidales bacterium]
MKPFILTAFLTCLFSLTAGISQTPVTTPKIDVGFEERQGEYVALDTRLINENGDTVLLGSLIDKPTILSLVYYRCPGTCSPLMWGIAKVLDQVDLEFGKDYQVLTVSFDPTETIDLGIQKKGNYLKNMSNKSLGKDWLFFVGDSANIAKLTNSVGFHYKWIAGQYTHPTGLIALASDGKITRYLRGIEFLPFDIKITMVEAADGKIGPSINRLLAFCYSYDTEGNEFVFNITKVAGILITFISLVIFLILVFSRRKTKKT